MTEVDSGNSTRMRILSAAVRLLNEGGRDAVTTRAVAEAAGIQAPTLYRIFQDKGGLLEAVAEHGFAAYLEGKQRTERGSDPVANLCSGWDLHVEFGLANPAIYLLMYANPEPGKTTPAAEASYGMLRRHIHQVAVTGRLRLSEERAAHLFHAAACGIVLLLLGVPPAQRDIDLSKIARDATLAAITTDAPPAEIASPAAAAAITLRAHLPEAEVLSPGERVLLGEWLDRLAIHSAGPAN